MSLDPPRRFDKIHRVVVVLLDAGRHGQHIGIKNDIGGIEPDLLRENLVRTGADCCLAFEAVRLPFFVEGHDDHRRPIPADQGGLVDEFLLAFLQTDAVDDRLPLNVLQPRLQHVPFGAIDHDGNLADIRLRRDQAEEFFHRRL
jgi:hypothetical protein